ncbi:MAG: hypothetical protein JWN25_558 [Verrucomicrobiales bacterium]|nr:hypothetical protein [Verrucomicrobiales bacterium]
MRQAFCIFYCTLSLNFSLFPSSTCPARKPGFKIKKIAKNGLYGNLRSEFFL